MSTTQTTSKKSTPKKGKTASKKPDDSKPVTDSKPYVHPYKLTPESLEKDTAYALKAFDVPSNAHFNPSKMTESHGGNFNVQEPAVAEFCNPCKGRIVRLLNDDPYHDQEMRIGESAANVITLSTCKLVDDILRATSETGISDKIKSGKSTQKSKVIFHKNLESVLRNHPITRKYGIFLGNTLETRVSKTAAEKKREADKHAANLTLKKEEQKEEARKNPEKPKKAIRKVPASGKKSKKPQTSKTKPAETNGSGKIKKPNARAKRIAQKS